MTDVDDDGHEHRCTSWCWATPWDCPHLVWDEGDGLAPLDEVLVDVDEIPECGDVPQDLDLVALRVPLCPGGRPATRCHGPGRGCTCSLAASTRDRAQQPVGAADDGDVGAQLDRVVDVAGDRDRDRDGDRVPGLSAYADEDLEDQVRADLGEQLRLRLVPAPARRSGRPRRDLRRYWPTEKAYVALGYPVPADRRRVPDRRRA